MNIETKHITSAYRKLKRLVYYDKTDLNLRRRLAEFECDTSFKKKLQVVKKVINSDEPLQELSLKRWLKDISFRVVPKSLEKNESSIGNNSDSNGKFISNVTTAKIYRVSRVNYFFDGPIELHLIAVLWIMFEGCVLDNQLGKECYGARLEDVLNKPDDQSAGLFRKYHELYARWRDSGIRKAKQILIEEKTSVCILGLDVQEYYYHIRLDFQSIAQTIQEARLEETEHINPKLGSSNLLKCIEAIYETYRKKITPFLQLTHKNVPTLGTGIPIGLCSSPLLANWYLRDFDKAVKKHVRPAYYGRYVDDILIVVQYPDDTSKEKSPVASFMDRVMVRTGILHEPKDNRYELSSPRKLFLQQSKCILQYFDSEHSIAGLEKFQKKLEESGSDFLLLPVDEADSSLEDIAFELLYEGSTNKFRNVKGVAENRYELAKHLARQTILFLLTDDPPDLKISLGLRNFFKGKNAIEFHDLWERVFTFFLIAEDSTAATDFAKYLDSEIKRIKHMEHPSITDLLVSNLKSHLRLSFCISAALNNSNLKLSAINDNIMESFRRANLIRHHFVRIPLLNYTTHAGSLTARIVEIMVKTDPSKLELSPRYVNFDECLLLAKSGNVKISRPKAFQWAQDIYKEINKHKIEEGIEWESIEVREKE